MVSAVLTKLRIFAVTYLALLLFNQIIPLKKAMSKRIFFCLNSIFGTLHNYLRWYCCRRNKFAIKTLLYNTQYFYMADRHM